jgi:hypothetical protein
MGYKLILSGIIEHVLLFLVNYDKNVLLEIKLKFPNDNFTKRLFYKTSVLKTQCSIII